MPHSSSAPRLWDPPLSHATPVARDSRPRPVGDPSGFLPKPFGAQARHRGAERQTPPVQFVLLIAPYALIKEPNMKNILFDILALTPLSAGAMSDFSGRWEIELCYGGKDKPCGAAHFSLLQNGTRICGDHTFYTAGAGRMNEGSPGSVRGVVIGDTAVLVVRSGRNGALVLGKATRAGQNLRWQSLEEIDPGNPVGDGLILGEGVLKRTSHEITDEELKKACKTGP